MLPDKFMQKEVFPQTLTGKIDRKELRKEYEAHKNQEKTK